MVAWGKDSNPLPPIVPLAPFPLLFIDTPVRVVTWSPAVMQTLTRVRSLFLNALRPLFLCALLTACVHVEQKLTLNPDGSGSFDVRYGMSNEDIANMEAMSKQAMQVEGLTNETDNASPFDFNEEDIRSDFKEYEQHGVTLNSVRISDSNDWKYVDLGIHFKSLEGLAKTEFIAERTIALTRRPDGNYEFVQSAPVQGMNPADMAGLDEASIKSLMAEMMKGFHARMQVVTPGKIVETSAESHDERTATWDFDLDKDPGALDRAQKLDLRIVFEGTGLELKDFTSADGT